MDPDQLSLIPLWYAVFLLSVTCHEAAHALVAYKGGDPTAYHGGQVSLNPIPHVRREPVGTMLVPLLTYLGAGWMMGWASAPYDPSWADRHPRSAALMAAAGPAANLLLAMIAFTAIKLGIGAGIWSAPDYCCTVDQYVVAATGAGGAIDALGRLCSIMLTLNLLLFLFNLVPLPPLDGAAIVGGLAEGLREPLQRLAMHPAGSMAGLVVAFLLFSRLPLVALIRDWLLFPGYYAAGC